MSNSTIELLNNIALNLKKDLNADYSFIGIVDEQFENVRTVSLCSDVVLDNICYNAEGTPCYHVLNAEPCIFQSNVQQLFPKDQMLVDMGINAYVGYPLFSLDRKKVIGLFGCLFHKEIKETEHLLEKIEFLTPRVELELDRMLLSNELADNKALFDAISNQTTEGITVADMEGNYLYVNQAFCKMSGYTQEELLKMTVFDMKAKNQDHQSFYDSKEEYEGVAIRVNLQKKDGTEYLTEIIGDVINVNGVEQVLGTIRDISDKVKAEREIMELNRTLEQKVIERTAELQESLNMKQVLLKEIAHRVKNNLQVIASILNLQKSISVSEESQKICTETSSRIHSMALIHEALYKNDNYRYVQFKDYTESLIDFLLDVYNATNIRVNQNIYDCLLPLDAATSCGMIIIELVSNSFKYGFPNQEAGKIDVILDTEDCVNYNLMIRDNGIGFPEGFSIEDTTTLGTQLVSSLVEQIEGEYTISNNGGAVFEMAFVSEGKQE